MGFWLQIIIAFCLLLIVMRWSARHHSLLGFGGWLIPIVIAQAIAPLRSLRDLSGEIGYLREIAALPHGAVTATAEAFLALAFLSLQIAATVAMFRRSRAFPALFLGQFFALIGVFIADALLTARLGIPLLQTMQKYEVIRLAAIAGASGIAALYLRRAQRPRATFVR